MTNAGHDVECGLRDRPAADLSIIKVSDDVSDEALERNERFKKRMAIYSQTEFVESYRDGDLGVGLRCVSGEFEQYGFVFEALRLVHSCDFLVSSTEYHYDTWFRNEFDQPFVLTQNVQLMEGPEEVITTRVGVHRFDDSAFPSGEPLFAFYPVHWIKEVVLGAENGEVRIVTRRHAVALGQGRGKQVKCAPEGADNRTGLGIEDGRKWLFCMRHKGLLSRLRIEIYNRGINVLSPPGMEPPREDWELGFAPINACLRI